MARTLPPPLFLFLFVALFLHSHESTSFRFKLVRREINNMAPPFKNLNGYYFSKIIRPRLTRETVIYTIDFKVGTPSEQRTLIFDTRSDLTWMQCTPSQSSFAQAAPLFDPRSSRSYQKLPPNHNLAHFFNCSNGNECIFSVRYRNGQSTSGIASLETFTFPSNRWWPSSESTKGVAFGCSNNFQGDPFLPSINGVMGMNRSPLSLVGQMGTRAAPRFSYCFPKIDSHVNSTFLRFGNDVRVSVPLQRTNFVSRGNDYSVSLVNITVAGRLLKVSTNTFPSPCIIHVGSAVSHIKMEAYNETLRTLRGYFRRYNLTRVTDGPSSNGDLCYRKTPEVAVRYPSMRFHFDGAILEIASNKLFRYVSGDTFCLALSGSNRVSSLGAFQMQDVRFVFDIANDKLLFATEDCSKDRA